MFWKRWPQRSKNPNWWASVLVRPLSRYLQHKPITLEGLRSKDSVTLSSKYRFCLDSGFLELVATTGIPAG
jgi:hypothetical protein